jgi:hypothetical protein
MTTARIGAIALAAGLSALTVTSARAECTTLGSVGTGINEGVAKFMAEAGLKNIRESKGLKADGGITYKCEAGMFLTDCHAKQRACR